MKILPTFKLPIFFSFAIALLLPFLSAQDAFIRDNPGDTGIEPNPSTGPMWTSPDIWVRRNPDPNWVPYPHPTASPTWTPQAHQNPEYRESDFAQPNYVYVRVTNRGTSATSGAERLRVYWAKASTGLNWPNHWTGAPGNSDADTYYANDCGVWRVFGKEITKPRKEGSTATDDEKQIYADAVAALDSAVHPGSSTTYFDLQDVIHTSGHSQHFNDAFVAWHREYVNRYEQALLKIDPRVTFLYWDWNRPAPTNGDYDFLGQFGTSSWYDNVPGAPPSAVSVGAPFNTFSPAITRGPFNTNLQSIFKSDATVLLASDYGQFAYIGRADPSGGGFSADGDVQSNPHNIAHLSTGQVWQPNGSGGDELDNRGANLAGNFGQAAEDPFFFMLHGNVDRLWAEWQRDQSLAGYNLNRLDPATAYNGASNTDLEFNNAGAVVTNTNGGLNELNGTIGPWDGVGAGIAPWTAAGGYINAKPYNHASVVSPPIYDTAPLYIPALQVGESVIIQIPWYPPNPNDFDCFGNNGSDKGHFCLLARIETATASPYGMTTTEGLGINANVRNNNNIAWKNLTVVDDFSGLGLSGIVGGIVVRNIDGLRTAVAALQFNTTNGEGETYRFDQVGMMTVDLPAEIFQRWQQAGARGEGIKVIDPDAGRIQILEPGAKIFNIQLAPGEFFGATPQFQLGENRHNATQRRFQLNVLQLQNNEIVGGNTYNVDFEKIRLVKTGSRWTYQDRGIAAPVGWNTAEFKDDGWKVGNADFGYELGDTQAKYTTHLDTFRDTRNDRAVKREGQDVSPYEPIITSYFRHEFQSAGADAYRSLILRAKADDGLIVYLNGVEVSRYCLRGGAVDNETYADESVEGAQENFYRTYDISKFLQLLKPGNNVIAAELHQAEGSYDAVFDLELFADGPDQLDTSPVVAINLHDSVHCIVGGTMCSVRSEDAISLMVDAVDDRQIVATRVYLNGQLFKEVQGNKIESQFFSRGLHNNGAIIVRAEAIDDTGKVGSTERIIHVVDNLPPIVSIRSLGKRSIVREGAARDIEVNAGDLDGEVAAVRFFYKSCSSSLGVPAALFAEVNEPPYTATARNLHAGAQIITVQVEDNDGATVEESVTILGARYPDLVLETTPPNGAISISWDQSVLQSARLQSSTDLVNWNDVTNSQTPYQVSTREGRANYYRLAYDLNEAIETTGLDVGPVNIGVGPVVNPDDAGVIVDPGGGPIVDNFPGIVGAAVAAERWQLSDRNGDEQSLDDFRGEPLVMLFFLGHDCLACLEQLEAMRASYAAFESAGVNVVAVSPDTVADLGKMQEFPFDILSDADRSVFNAYGVKDAEGEPTHAVVVIDGGGQLVLNELSELPDLNLGRILAIARGQ